MLRTILALIVLVILAHLGLVYAGVDEFTNGLTEVIYSLGRLLETPAEALLATLQLTEEQRTIVGGSIFYTTALAAAAGYFTTLLAARDRPPGLIFRDGSLRRELAHELLIHIVFERQGRAAAPDERPVNPEPRPVSEVQNVEVAFLRRKRL